MKNNEQIEMKLSSIKEYVKENNNITTLKEIADYIGLSKKETKSILLTDPEFNYEVMNLIEYNRTKNLKKICQKNTRAKKSDDTKKRYVLDASVSGAEDNQIVFSLMKNSLIVLTSVTIGELDMLQKREDRSAWFARKILALANEKPECFEFIKIKENFRLADDNIIEFCKENKADVTLLTSDKVMALKARYSDVSVVFLKSADNVKGEERTLYCTLIKDGRLVIRCSNNEKKCIRVIGSSSSDNEVELKVGDEIYIASNKGDYIKFSHLVVSNLNYRDNCRIVFTKKIRKKETISHLNCSYKSFIREFNKKAKVLL